MAFRALVCAIVACSTIAYAAAASGGPSSGVVDYSTIPTLEHNDLKEMLTTTDGVWLVMVGSAECGEPCEMVRETLTKAQAKAGEIMSFGYMDARAPLINDKGEETVVALEFNITAVPALLYYAYGPKAVIPSHTINPDVIGALVGRGLKYFLKFLRNFLPSRATKVTALGLKKFMTFEAPELQRVLLVTKKKQSPLPYDRLSLQFDRRAIFGFASPSDEDLLARFGLDEDDVPALLVSPPGGETLDHTAERFEWTRYDGGDMSYSTLSAWLHEVTERVPVPLLNAHSKYEETCIDKGGVCFIAFLPDEDYDLGLEIVRRTAERVYVTPNIINNKFTTEALPMRFAWAQADHQPSVVSAFGLDIAPGIVGVSARKDVYTTYVGPFTERDIHKFVVDTILLQKNLLELDAPPTFNTVDSPEEALAKKQAKKKGKKKGKKGKKKGKKGKKKGKKKAKKASEEL